MTTEEWNDKPAGGHPMTPTTLAETILRDVPRYRLNGYDAATEPAKQGGIVFLSDVLAALSTALDPSLAERVGKVLEGVTGPKWEVLEEEDGVRIVSPDCDLDEPWYIAKMIDGIGQVPDAANARFIAWARNNVPALLAQIAALRAERDAADDALVDRYRDPKTGVFKFPADVAAIVRRLDAAEAVVDKLRGALQKAYEALLWCARDGRMASPLLHQYPAKWAEEARAALPARGVGVPTKRPDAPAHIVEYTNWRGETARRTIIPIRMWWGSTEWHPQEQWMLTAWDVEKDAARDFAWQDMRPVQNGATSAAVAAQRAALPARGVGPEDVPYLLRFADGEPHGTGTHNMTAPEDRLYLAGYLETVNHRGRRLTAKGRALVVALAPTDATQDDDPECTDCGGTGITYQTERRCSCQGPDLSDPVAVHANMLRGTIAKPTVEQIIHLYGREAFQPMIVAAVAKALEEACLAVSEHADWPEDEHGRTEQVGLFARVINAILAITPARAAHVNETPKSEHDGADVLTAAQARDAALREAAAVAKAHEKEVYVWSENYAGLERKLSAAEAEVEKLREAADWQEKHRRDAFTRRHIHAPEDPHVAVLCERYGYGAVMDAASRLWARKDSVGAFYIGGCIGIKPDAALSAALDPALTERAGEVLERLSKLADDMDRHATEEWDESELLCNVGDTIRALLAQIAALRAERDRYLRHLTAGAESLNAYKARADAAEAEVEKLRGALSKLHHAVCGETGFAACVRLDSGKAYPWPALDDADEAARAALTTEADNDRQA